MSRKKRRDGEASAPASGAGLPSFLGESTDSIVKVRPELVFGLTVALIITIILANTFIGIL